MKLRYLTRTKRMTFEFEVSNVKEAFSAVAEVQEVFEERQCGRCEGTDLRFETREIDGNNYYSMRCLDCRAQLDFGQLRGKPGLFVKHKGPDGERLPDGGWYDWRERRKQDD